MSEYVDMILTALSLKVTFTFWERMNRMKRISVSAFVICCIGITILMGICLSSCGDKSSPYAGEWYNASDIDGKVLILSEDWKFSCGEAAGNYSVQDNILIFETTTAGYGSDTAQISKAENGETCFVDNDGDIWFSSYETAYNYHEAETEETISSMEDAVVGNWYGDAGSKGHTLVINEDGTYEAQWGSVLGDYYEAGTWETYRDGDRLCIAAEETKHETNRDDWHNSCLNGKVLSESGDGEYRLSGGDETRFEWLNYNIYEDD